MSQHDYDIANQSFPAFRTDLNNVLGAINSSNSGTSRPSGAVSGTIWLDTTSASTPTLKYYDGANWQAIVAGGLTDIVQDGSPQLGGTLDVNGNSIVSVSNGKFDIKMEDLGKCFVKLLPIIKSFGICKST